MVKKGQTNELCQMQIELFVRHSEIESFRPFAQDDKECAVKMVQFNYWAFPEKMSERKWLVRVEKRRKERRRTVKTPLLLLLILLLIAENSMHIATNWLNTQKF